jgi:hypothetical protein
MYNRYFLLLVSFLISNIIYGQKKALFWKHTDH